MEVEDIFSIPEKLTISGKEYQYEFDNKAYATLQVLIKKSLSKTKKLLLDDDLFFEDYIELVCAGLIIHHKPQEIEEVRQELYKHLGTLSTIHETVVKGYLKNQIAPEIYLKMEEIRKKIQGLVDEQIENTEKKKKKTRKKKTLTGYGLTQ